MVASVGGEYGITLQMPVRIVGQAILSLLIILAFFAKAYAEELSEAPVHTLRIHTWEGYADADMVEAFTQAMLRDQGLRVALDIQYVSDPHDCYAALRLSKTDLISPAHNLIKDERFQYISKGILLPINTENIPNYKKIIPALRDADYATDQGKVYAVPFAHGAYALIYNQDEVDEIPESWKVLWDPKYANRYVISADYYEVNYFITVLSLGHNPSMFSDVDQFRNKSFIQRLRKLRSGSREMWVGVDTEDNVEGSAMATSWGFSLAKLNSQGIKWKRAVPKEGVTGWVDNTALSRTLADKPVLKMIAESWINFLISPKVQHEVVIQRLSSDPVSLGVIPRLSKSEIATHHLNNLDYFKNNRYLWPTLKKSQRDMIKSLWERAGYEEEYRPSQN